MFAFQVLSVGIPEFNTEGEFTCNLTWWLIWYAQESLPPFEIMVLRMPSSCTLMLLASLILSFCCCQLWYYCSQVRYSLNSFELFQTFFPPNNCWRLAYHQHLHKMNGCLLNLESEVGTGMWNEDFSCSDSVCWGTGQHLSPASLLR